MGINFHPLSDEDKREKYILVDYSIPANHNRIKKIFMDEYEDCQTGNLFCVKKSPLIDIFNNFFLKIYEKE